MSTQSALKTLNRSSSSRALRISRVLGMKDTLSERESVLQQHIIHTAQQAALNYGAYRITTPIVEKTALYTRTLGEQTDVVQKEMFTWMDEGRNGEKQASLCLRPEGTAGTVRAFIQGHNHLPLPLRYFYDGPMFRREKPQKGRHRQFTQIGVEFLGEDHALADVEAIAMGWAIIQQLSLQDSVTLQVHTMGTEQARQAYNDALRDYLQPRAHNLCEESQKRMAAGHYLRILDSKDRTDQYLLDQAPTLLSCATKK
ncbi:hypothetical protein SARC_03735 [Sphaeroforma arctica JP610]|uniref:histidine--tRNA ligase n=1 Tax=Sphaeroforma arctica JP610 TaxID=667725 RepID=A0A0L0G527_9EUKA|nr:hypothetical protein SARC_03735 [Sphaeroforma arctica JP610]KNC84024.1 hypothetical protein SARC_03735 [Sphaeroforma arctica JP610]|eukprot:XP_014157926.1 hypothetical protein SARC_03735 [Sphaeroforma arctica JP610]